MARKLGAIVLFAVAAFMALGYSLSTADVSASVTMFSALLTIGLPVAVGIALLRSGSRSDDRMQQLRQQTIDAEILRLAAARGGKLTLVELTVALGLNEGEVQQSLDAMARREVADVDVSEDGVVIYSFHDAKHLANKHTAKGLLDA